MFMENLGGFELLLILVVGGIIVIPFWKIFSKAGFPAIMSMLMIIPFLNIIVLFYLGFAEWPNLKKSKTENAA